MTDTKTKTHIHTDSKGRFYDKRVRDNLSASAAKFDTAKSVELGGELAIKESIAALRCASHDFRIHMDRWLERHDLSEGRMGALWAIQRAGTIPLGDLAEILDVSARNVTGLIDHLESDTLVERFPDPIDRRSIRVRLTNKGGEKLKQIKKESSGSLSGLVKGFSSEELELLRHLCLKLVHNMQEDRR